MDDLENPNSTVYGMLITPEIIEHLSENSESKKPLILPFRDCIGSEIGRVVMHLVTKEELKKEV